MDLQIIRKKENYNPTIPELCTLENSGCNINNTLKVEGRVGDCMCVCKDLGGKNAIEGEKCDSLMYNPELTVHVRDGKFFSCSPNENNI